MKTISIEEITKLYKSCGLNSLAKFDMRTDINTGTLNNQLNSSYGFLNRSSVIPSSSSYYVSLDNSKKV